MTTKKQPAKPKPQSRAKPPKAKGRVQPDSGARPKRAAGKPPPTNEDDPHAIDRTQYITEVLPEGGDIVLNDAFDQAVREARWPDHILLPQAVHRWCEWTHVLTKDKISLRTLKVWKVIYHYANRPLLPPQDQLQADALVAAFARAAERDDRQKLDEVAGELRTLFGGQVSAISNNAKAANDLTASAAALRDCCRELGISPTRKLAKLFVDGRALAAICDETSRQSDRQPASPDELALAEGEPHPFIKNYNIVPKPPGSGTQAEGKPSIWLLYVGKDWELSRVLFNMDRPFEISTPEWDEWVKKRKSLWPLQAAVRLIFGLAQKGVTAPPPSSPAQHITLRRYRVDPDASIWPPEAVVLEQRAREAIKAGDLTHEKGKTWVRKGFWLEVIPQDVVRGGGCLPGEEWEQEYYVRPREFLELARDLGYSIPEPLLPLLNDGPVDGPPSKEKAANCLPGRPATVSVDHGGEGEQSVGRVLDGEHDGWRMLTRPELDSLEKDKAVGLYIKGRHVVRAPGKPKGKVTLSDSEYKLLVFYAERRGKEHEPREGHRGEADNACNMLSRLLRKIDKRREWFKHSLSAPNRKTRWCFAPPANARFAIVTL